MRILLGWLGASLCFPVILDLAVGRLPLVAICLLNIALGLAMFHYVRDARAMRAAELRSLADILWGVWGFIGITVLFGSLDVLQGLDLRAVIAVLRRWPLLYGLLANGLLVAATIRIASAVASLLPLAGSDVAERDPLP